MLRREKLLKPCKHFNLLQFSKVKSEHKVCNKSTYSHIDLKAFNIALVAKEGWRILYNRYGLLHKIYKPIYFTQ